MANSSHDIFQATSRFLRAELSVESWRRQATTGDTGASYSHWIGLIEPLVGLLDREPNLDASSTEDMWRMGTIEELLIVLAGSDSTSLESAMASSAEIKAQLQTFATLLAGEEAFFERVWNKFSQVEAILAAPADSESDGTEDPPAEAALDKLFQHSARQLTDAKDLEEEDKKIPFGDPKEPEQSETKSLIPWLAAAAVVLLISWFYFFNAPSSVDRTDFGKTWAANPPWEDLKLEGLSTTRSQFNVTPPATHADSLNWRFSDKFLTAAGEYFSPDYPGAINTLTGIDSLVPQLPQNEQTAPWLREYHFVLGLSYLARSQTTAGPDSVADLNRAQGEISKARRVIDQFQLPETEREAYFLAVSLGLSGKFPEARQLLKKIPSGNIFYEKSQILLREWRE